MLEWWWRHRSDHGVFTTGQPARNGNRRFSNLSYNSIYYKIFNRFIHCIV